MNEVNQANNSNAPPNIPVKRKRGRPRKDHSLNRRESVQMPPGFEGVKGNQPRQLDAIEAANDSIVGQAVTGVVDAAFDAGYLLSVRIGNSNTSLRGVVFKPGHYVPISSQNDVAPHVQMIRRNEIPLPIENRNWMHGRRPRSKERNEKHGNLRRVETGPLLDGPPPANRFAPQTADPVASKGKHVLPASACAVPPVGSRGTVVPVVLQPVNSSNGLLPVNQIPPVPSHVGHIAAPNHKQVQTFASQMLPSQPQASHQVTPVGMQNENDPFQQGAGEVLCKEEGKSMKQTGVSTPYEVNKRVQVYSQSSETHTQDMAAGKSSAEDSGIRDIDNMNEPLLVEPLQAIRSHIHNQSEPVPKPSEKNKIGRMSELLQALQENMTEPGA